MRSAPSHLSLAAILVIAWLPAPETPSDGVSPKRRPFTFISARKMLENLRELSSIGGSNLYRTSGSQGERDAFSWLAGKLAELGNLEAMGAFSERANYRIPLAADVRAASLILTVSGRDFDVPAHALQGHREDLALALRYDSDGLANDDSPDPVTRMAATTILRRSTDLYALRPGSLRGRIAVADYALIDRGVLAAAAATQAATILLQAEPAALVLVTKFSNVRGQSHGSFAGDVSVLVGIATPPSLPTLLAKIEDMAAAGIRDIPDLDRISHVKLTWDADVSSPASSEYLAFRIPGADSSRAILLGAHLDSANSPGAMDDGSGVVTLLEAARVLDEGRVQPPVDVYLLFFGSHERGLYGSSVFAASHSELLDRAVAMLEIDCLTHPLDGLHAELVLQSQSFAGLGDSRLPFPESLRRQAARLGVRVWVADVQGVASDNSSFAGFGVPNADTIYVSEAMNEVHVEGHLHDPYDDMPLAELHATELSGMATVALNAILDLPVEESDLRVTPPPSSRAVFVASHAEAVQMTPAHLSMLGMLLAFEGWDVDVVPYGTPVTDADLAGAGLVVALPVVDYPQALAGTEAYDEAWTPAEIEVLKRYVESGGFLVLPNSATRLRYGTATLEPNEDWPDANALGSEFGITFADRRITETRIPTLSHHALVSGILDLRLLSGNGLAIAAPQGEVLARSPTGNVAATLVPAGSKGGEVLALADLSILAGKDPTAPNLAFWRNLARFGLARRTP